MKQITQKLKEKQKKTCEIIIKVSQSSIPRIKNKLIKGELDETPTIMRRF